ncbi:hypothetical protein A2625_06965 [candidate division WOR-1 bacterium RIFCSPHIGHO2_01_FULL_53_15]|uniref:Thioredoxin domain-containing protein n=1 Tax=candidate division WOR-1 bacterium RIFCSPHIGHO2_01_FULL_53_15 TaxID=1802564 RepID=A0A1F4Q4F8_UNCSA|nr:MAG: hypothetical protein A2625_06965 [candidate division WOR-1 bacterium RIFCSPHIGHO2_01_FULL_53_15]OGC13228.1 MAG: hypothetical protein A3D23_01215 [candidate division WOR-1 bacterium RIFCSPHIGHO2_02_FULL_53_26]
MKKLIIGVLLAGLALCFAAAAEPAPKIGAEAPALELPSVGGQTFTLIEFKGKKVILTFFASWSKTCQDELRALADIYSNRKPAFEILAVSFDKKSKDLKTYLAETDPPFPILVDKKLSTLDTFQILIIPTTFCVNGDGVIEKIFVDFDDNVKQAIEEWQKS